MSGIEYKGVDITAHLKAPDVDEWSSLISQNTQVRIIIVSLARKCAEGKNMIAEGRDCGSVIFPQAAYKFFLTASLDVRAERWQESQRHHGIVVPFDQARAFIVERDERDMTRKVDPLVIPPGAKVIDNSTLSLEQTVELLKSFIVQKHNHNH